MQITQRPANSAAAATLHEGDGRRIRGIRDPDREAAALFADDLELLTERVFSAYHADAHQHAIIDAR